MRFWKKQLCAASLAIIFTMNMVPGYVLAEDEKKTETVSYVETAPAPAAAPASAPASASAPSAAAPSQTASSTGESQSSTNQAPAASSSPSGTQQQNKPAANVDDDDEGFNGTFEKSDGEEKVQIKVEGSDKIRFVFRTSMINGTAKINGNTAQYTGDDDYKIIFDVAEDILMVTVEGEDGDLSDMNGIYYRDYGDDETEDDDAVFDGDETEEADDYFEDDDLEDFLEDETE